MHFKTAYLKLTFFYTLIVMIISVVFSIVLYQISSNELDRGLGRQSRFIRELPINNLLPDRMQEMEQSRFEQFTESSQHLKLNLIRYNLLILVLSSIASYFFARKTLKPIEEMMEAQNHFTADASHELRTPLTAMRAEIEVNLRNKNLNAADAKKLLESNLEEIAKLESLSSALLKLSKYHEDFKLDFKKVLLSEIITEAYEKIENLAEKKKIEFENSFKDVFVNGDKQNLIELFVILLDNAVKYSPNHSKISININKEDKFAEVVIADRGMGIKASDLPYIFNRFYRADTSRSKEKIDGYGLGLSIAKRIAELHNGKISATSRPGKGSEFTVRLPIV